MSQSVSLLELKKFDKTKIQRWRLFFGGDGIGKKKNDDSRIRYSDGSMVLSITEQGLKMQMGSFVALYARTPEEPL